MVNVLFQRGSGSGQTSTGMRDFRTKFQTTSLPHTNPNIRLAVNETTVNFFTPTSRAAISRVTPWLIRECATGEEDPMPEGCSEHQVCAYYASAICLSLPELVPDFKRALERNGANTVDVNETDIIDFGYDSETAEVWEQNHVLVAVGHMIFLLYKNISEVNYGKFMTNRGNAMRAIAGVTQHLIDDEEILFGIKSAGVIRTRLGSDHHLKKRVLEICLYLRMNAVPPIDTLFTYVTDILAWNDMSALVFVCENLLMTNSPVIRDVSMRSELTRLKETFEVLNKDVYPQYYRIMNPPHLCSILNRNRFPTLIAVAQAARPGQSDPSKQFVAPSGVDANLLVRLTMMHMEHLARIGEIVQSKSIDYLTQFDDNVVFNEDRIAGEMPPTVAEVLAAAATKKNPT